MSTGEAPPLDALGGGSDEIRIRQATMQHLSISTRPVRSPGESGKCPPNARRFAMTKYLLSTHTVEDETREPRTEEEMHEIGRRVGTIEREMKSSGAWGFSGRLHEPDTATVVRVSDGEVLTTDGPFAESKEHLGGFYIIE